ncbi:MAG: NAD(P)H-hydrate dehydratase [Candidatus Micrarchaeota archaeon]
MRESVVKSLAEPLADSHKGHNGILTIIGGSSKYHGAPLLCVQAASRFVDLVYFHSPEREVASLVRRMREKSKEFIVVQRRELDARVRISDCVLVGNGMAADSLTGELVNGLLRRHKKKMFVLDAAAIRVVDRTLLGPNCVITPHANEFYALFGVAHDPREILRQASRYGCVILFKGKHDFISDGKTIWRNITGNAGMTKGGTGDVLAGLTAALCCRNDPLDAAKAAAYINGLAGDLLYQKVRHAFNAGDLANELPLAYKEAMG